MSRWWNPAVGTMSVEGKSRIQVDDIEIPMLAVDKVKVEKTLDHVLRHLTEVMQALTAGEFDNDAYGLQHALGTSAESLNVAAEHVADSAVLYIKGATRSVAMMVAGGPGVERSENIWEAGRDDVDD